MFTLKPRLQLEKFAINGAKRLLQHNRCKSGHTADITTMTGFDPLPDLTGDDNITARRNRE